ncbi:MAG TPA: PrsW family glutamic-type intramembrane protease [Gemmataceae bacterium]|jgi:RsiW-degrading membrane proteinase PrsW (M82 family)|nr:PrsW family glutamic-type intramembrane protease [Gemmataceae bacterium]
MPISVKCPACGKGHKAPDKLAGKSVSCLNCGQPFAVPVPDLEAAAAAVLDSDGPPSGPPSPPEPAEGGPPEIVEPTPRPRRRKPDVTALPPLTTNDPPLWLRHLHWLLALALIPLAVSLLAGHDDKSLLDRISETLERAGPADQARFEAGAEKFESLHDLVDALPEHRLVGAALPASTGWHWGLAALATVIFLAFMMFLASDGSANPMHVLIVGLTTATAGVAFLFLVQGLASFTEGRVIVGRGVIVLLFYILKFIAFSYSAASDPENGFLLSFVGFTLGVGLCEELVKAIPLFWHRDDNGGKNWRGLFIWGLASGAGFGIAEGILYSGRYYNGITGADAYAVRFLSCVALHAIWTGSVAITLYLRRDLFNNVGSWHDYIGPTLFVLGVPMVLHGLYDTCLKKEMNGVALLVALASFGYLAFLNSRLRGADDEAAKRAMLREYRRRRAMVQ